MAQAKACGYRSSFSLKLNVLVGRVLRTINLKMWTLLDVRRALHLPAHLLITAKSLKLTAYSLQLPHSHSMVAGGLLEMSRTTRLTPFTSLIRRLLRCARKSWGSRVQSAVMASTESTTRKATTFS
jgi:hypothetical protein